MSKEEPMINELLDQYFSTKDSIHKAFGYKEDWVAIQLSDNRGLHWLLVGSEEDGTVVYSEQPLTPESVRAGEIIYSGQIYTQRFLPKWVYRTPTHVMISVDTRCDGNKFLMVFDAGLEVDDDELRRIWSEQWSDAAINSRIEATRKAG